MAPPRPARRWCRRPQTAQARRRIVPPSSDGRESTTRSSSDPQKGQRTADPPCAGWCRPPQHIVVQCAQEASFPQHLVSRVLDPGPGSVLNHIAVVRGSVRSSSRSALLTRSAAPFSAGFSRDEVRPRPARGRRRSIIVAKTRDALSVEHGPARRGLQVRRLFTTKGTHPYDELTWERRTPSSPTGAMAPPPSSSATSSSPPTGRRTPPTSSPRSSPRPLGTPQREHSVRQMVDRVAGTIAGAPRTATSPPTATPRPSRPS